MEIIMQNLPAAVSAVLMAVLILTVITNIIVEVLKKALLNMPTNLIAICVAMTVTLVATVAACQILGVGITWYLIAGAVGLGFFVAFAAMFGFDKFKQMLEQIASAKSQ